MASILSDELMDAEFQRDGFVVRPFLNPEEVRALEDLLHASTPEIPSDFYVTPSNPDLSHRRRVHEEVKAVLAPRLKTLLPGYKICLAAFVVKRPRGTRSPLPLHNDDSYVDPRIHTAVHVWCPLRDVDERNGCLRAVVGSHSLVRPIAGIPRGPSPWERVRAMLEAEFAASVPMAAGSAFLFDECLVHGSHANMTDEVRIAVGCAMIPEHLPPRLFCWEQEAPTRLKVLELPEDYLVTYQTAVAVTEPYPEGVRCVDVIEYQPETLNAEQVEPLRGLRPDLPRPKAGGSPHTTPATRPGFVRRLLARLR